MMHGLPKELRGNFFIVTPTSAPRGLWRLSSGLFFFLGWLRSTTTWTIWIAKSFLARWLRYSKRWTYSGRLWTIRVLPNSDYAAISNILCANQLAVRPFAVGSHRTTVAVTLQIRNRGSIRHTAWDFRRSKQIWRSSKRLSITRRGLRRSSTKERTWKPSNEKWRILLKVPAVYSQDMVQDLPDKLRAKFFLVTDDHCK